MTCDSKSSFHFVFFLSFFLLFLIIVLMFILRMSQMTHKKKGETILSLSIFIVTRIWMEIENNDASLPKLVEL